VLGVSLPVPISLSPSKVTAFQDCPMAFKFSAIDRIPQPPRPATTKGTLVHRALELLMLRAPAERTIEHALEDLARARVEIAAHPDYLLLDLTPDDAEAFHADAQVLVRRYFQLEDPTTVRPIGLECMVSMPLGAVGPGGNPVLLRGIIDRLELGPDGELVITDYKTGGVPSELYEHGKLAGVHIYALLCERVVGVRPVRVQLFYLQQPVAIIAEPTDQKVVGVEKRTKALWTAVERACHRDDFRARPGKLCDWCAYKPYCPAWGGDPAQAVELKEGLQRRLPIVAA
jgi:putative RecB family exonuclease